MIRKSLSKKSPSISIGDFECEIVVPDEMRKLTNDIFSLEDIKTGVVEETDIANERMNKIIEEKIENQVEFIEMDIEESIKEEKDITKNIKSKTFVNLGQVILNDLENKNLFSKIRVSDIKNEVSNKFGFYWEKGNHNVILQLKNFDEHSCRLNIKIKLPSGQIFMKKYNVENIMDFDTIRFKFSNIEVKDYIRIENILLNEQKVSNDKITRDSSDTLDINCKDIEVYDKFKISFNFDISKSTFNSDIYGNIGILFGIRK